ncbi:MAG TPA: TetR/AcrR family transcriptional regulator [Novosphingobium sp.]|nr:TetR/AcrR family transcriptional regulator [Novosphingobium sp.]HMP55152.1 TetR/AcrR family transcriptional regulator [Novosphingobium sp.]
MTAIAPPSPTRPRAGRPTREQAQARLDQLLDTALDHFLAKGFELATIEAIASEVGMTKRTVYARFPDKVALFRAALGLAADRYAVTPAEIAACETGDLEQTLRNLAFLRIDKVATPNGVRLQRILQTESYRFPDLNDFAFEHGAKETLLYLAALLMRETARGRLAVGDPARAAGVFMAMVVSTPVRFILAGQPMPRGEMEDLVAFSVRLFLDGARTRQTGTDQMPASGERPA